MKTVITGLQAPLLLLS